MTTNQQVISSSCVSRSGLDLVKSVLFAFILAFTVASLSAAQLPIINLPANSTSADIQKALDRLPDGGEVDLAEGHYLITEPIILKRDHQTLRGSGPKTILFLADKANCPVIIIGAALTTPKRKTAHLQVSDLLIDGNRKHQQVEMWRTAMDHSQLNNNGIDIWNSTDVIVQHVVCCSCRSGGLVTASGIRRLNVTDFTAFDNQFDGLACYLTEDSHFDGLSLHDNLGAGISLDLDFNHNLITNAVLSGNDLGIFMRQSCNNTFGGMTIENSHHHGIFMAQTGGVTKAGWALLPGTQCTGNSFDKLMITNSGGKAFLVNDCSCSNNVISNAKFLANLKGGLAQSDSKLVTVRELIQQ